jgi:hypothetical protein
LGGDLYSSQQCIYLMPIRFAFFTYLQGNQKTLNGHEIYT